MEKPKKDKKPEVEGKVKIYIPKGAPRLNLKADREAPPSTLYDRMEGQDWVKKIEGKKED